MGKKHESEEVLSQLRSIYNSYHNCKSITDFNPSFLKVSRQSTVIGFSVFVRSSNYEETYREVLEKGQYFLRLIDDSLIMLSYSFDKKGCIAKHTLSFLPSIETDKQYFRFDYSLGEMDDSFHSPTHMHLFLENENCRIPVDSVIYPFDFLYFILKYLYLDSSKFMETLKKSDNRKTLVKKEFERFFIRVC